MHHGVRLDQTKLKKMSGGTPKRVYTDSEQEIMRKIVFSEIPAIYGGRLLGWKHPLKKCLKDIMDKFGVVDYRNNLGCYLSFYGRVEQGRPVGWVEKTGGVHESVAAKREYRADEFGITVRYQNETPTTLPVANPLPGDTYHIISSFVFSEITAEDAAKALGVSRIHANSSLVRRFMTARNIVDFRNALARQLARSGRIYRGQATGWVQFSDGTIKTMFAKKDIVLERERGDAP